MSSALRSEDACAQLERAATLAGEALCSLADDQPDPGADETTAIPGRAWRLAAATAILLCIAAFLF